MSNLEVKGLLPKPPAKQPESRNSIVENIRKRNVESKGSSSVDDTEPKDSKDSTDDQQQHRFHHKLQIKLQSSTLPATEVFCCTYSPDSKLLATGCMDGTVRVFDNKGDLAYSMDASPSEQLPTTCVRFRPNAGSSKTKNVLLVANADGTVSHWHLLTRTNLYTTREEDNQVYALDYRPDGEMFASAGRDAKVRVYEESTKSLLMTLAVGNGHTSAGHSNRVYSVKFSPHDPTQLVSGGWDNTVQIWDTRAGISVRSIYGPHICGDGVDIHPGGKTLLTASWRPENALQLWDLGTSKLIENVPFNTPSSEPRPEALYTCQFEPTRGDVVAAGGSGTNEGKLIDLKSGKCLDTVTMRNKGVYAVSFSPSGRKLAVAGGDPQVTVIDL